MTYLYDHFKCKHARENVIKITENLQEEKISAMKPPGQRFAPSAPVRLCAVYAIRVPTRQGWVHVKFSICLPGCAPSWWTRGPLRPERCC